MQVLLNTDQVIQGSTENTVTAKPGAPARPSSPQPASENSKPQPPATFLQANVTFRRDNSGQIYYVVSDAQTGKELRELPPKAVRDVGQGIDEFLKQEQQKAAHSLEVKA